MRARLRDSDTKISPERALAKLRRIQHQKVKVNDLEPVAALSNMTQEHADILQALTVKKPTLPAHLNSTLPSTFSVIGDPRLNEINELRWFLC